MAFADAVVPPLVVLTPTEISEGFVKCAGAGMPVTSRNLNRAFRYLESLAGGGDLDHVVLDEVRNTQLTIGAANTENYGFWAQTVGEGTRVDGVKSDSTISGAAGQGFGIRGTSTSDAAVVSNAGGVSGEADGAGFGTGVFGGRTGAGNGSGVFASMLGTGTGAALTATKSNDGAGATGTGPAILATNTSNNGFAIFSSTSVNNINAASNSFRRLNGTQGNIADFLMTAGGVRTGPVQGVAVGVNPSAASTGTALVYGIAATLGANLQGTGVKSAVRAVNSVVGSNDAYGVESVMSGANLRNYGGSFTANGGTTNYAVYANSTQWAFYAAAGDSFFAGELVAPNLPVFADNVAAAALPNGTFYRTATGDLKVKF